MALAVSAWRDSRARSVRIQPSSAATNGLIRSCRTACRCSDPTPLISRSTAKISSMRRTASIASGTCLRSGNESPFGPSPLALEAMRAAAVDTLRLYPDPEAQELREALAVHHGIKPEQVFVGNGSDEVLAHTFAALLKQPKPLLFPDVTYSFYPVWAQLFGLACETVPLDDEMRVRVEDYRREAGSIVIANPNAPTGVALPRAEIARLLEDHPDIPVVIDEAYVDFGGESAVPLIADHPNLLVVQTMSKSRALAGLRVGYALDGVGLIEALHRVKNSFNSYPLGRVAEAGATASVRDEAYFRESCARVVAGREAMTRELIRLGFVVLP